MNFTAASESPSTGATGAPGGSAPHNPTSDGERAGHGHTPRGCGEQEANGRYLQLFLPLPCSPLHGAALAVRPERSSAPGTAGAPRSSRQQRPDSGSVRSAQPRLELQIPAGPGWPGRGRARLAPAAAANGALSGARGWRGP